MLTRILDMAIILVATLTVLVCMEHSALSLIILAMLTGAALRGVVDRLLLVVQDEPAMARPNRERTLIVPLVALDGVLVLGLFALWLVAA